jgi:NADPH:quinone reductase-like Zn-dependent oxidoreductase
MNLPYWYFKFRMYLNGFRFDSVLNKPTKERMQVVAKWIEEGKIRPVIGKAVKLEDIEAVREACKQIESGKGGIGKVVIEIS